MAGIKTQVIVTGLDRVQKFFKRAPSMTKDQITKALWASVFEVQKHAVDEQFQFKTPRGQRTGFLELSFNFKRAFRVDGNKAYIGPTAKYAGFVNDGTRFIRPNKYMDRIRQKAEPGIKKHFNNAMVRVTESI